MRLPLSGSPRITSRHGSPSSGSKFGKHMGIDWGVPVGTPVYAPASGKVRTRTDGPSGGRMLEIDAAGKWRRFLHLNDRYVNAGQSIAEGQLIARTGNTGRSTGPHLHYDVRKPNTTWDASFSNYIDPLTETAPSPGGNLPQSWVGKRVYLSASVETWRVYRPSTRIHVGTLRPKANGGLSYIIRGIDSLPNRVLIQSGTFGRVSLPIDKDATVR